MSPTWAEPLSSRGLSLFARAALVAAFASVAAGRAASQDAEVKAVNLRMELVKANGKTEPILIDEVKGVSAGDEGDLRAPNKTLPAGSWRQFVAFVTRDPRAVVPNVVVELPKQIPSELVVQVPAANHPSLSEVAIDIVDDASGKPLPEATFEHAEAAPPAWSTHADPKGRIVVGPAGEDSGFLRFVRGGACLHAPGHLSWDRDGVLIAEYGAVRVSVDGRYAGAEEIARQLDGKPLRIALKPDSGTEDRAVRVLLADGKPAVGATAVIGELVTVSPSLAISPSLDPRSLARCTARRVGPDGTVHFPVELTSRIPCVAIEVGLPRVGVIGGVPLQTFVVALSALPADKPRELTLPAVATMTLAISSLPSDTLDVRVDSFDALTPSREAVAAFRYDPGVVDMLSAEMKRLSDRYATQGPPAPRAYFSSCFLGEPRLSRSDVAPYRRPVAVGRTTTLWFDRWRLDPATHDRQFIETRRLDVEPDEAGPVFVARRWDDLPVEPRDR